jgi:hypothetical protein
VGIGALVLAVRLLRLPAIRSTTDLARTMNYAEVVRQHGLGALRHSLVWWHRPATSFWDGNVFNYPPVPLGFFWLLRVLGIGLVGARIALTLVDAATAALIGVRTRSRALGVAALALPQSQYWVSGEGQFEPLQAVFTVSSLVAFERFPFAAGVLLALAVQSKMTALAVVPVLLWWATRRGRTHLVRFGGGLALGLGPSVAVNAAYPMVHQVLSGSSLALSRPWQVDLLHSPHLPNWTSALGPALYLTMFLLIGTALWFVLATARRTPGGSGSTADRVDAVADHVPLLAFATFMCVHTNVMPWYTLLLPSFAMVPRSVKQRRILFVLAALAGLVTLRMS